MAIRYIGNPAGTQDGTSVANRAPWSALNTMVQGAGAGGEVRVVNDGTEISVNSAVNLNQGGTTGNRVRIHGVALDGSTKSLPVITGNRTHPWPTTAEGAMAASDGNGIITFSTGASHLEFYDLKFKACNITLLVNNSAQVSDIVLGYAGLLDTASHDDMLAFRSTYTRWLRGTSAAISAAAAYKTAVLGRRPTAGTYENAIVFENVNRGFDVGLSSAAGWKADGTGEPARLTGFRWVGGTITTCTRGALRIRGESSDAIIQDVRLDANYARDRANSFCQGFECNGYSQDNDGINIISRTTNVHFIRVQADKCWNNDINGGYTNGDGFTSERENDNLTYSCCQGYDNHDGCIDSKATDLILFNPVAVYGRRLLRLWGQADVYDMDLTDISVDRGGGSRAMVFSYQSDMVRLNSGTATFSPGWNPGGVTGNFTFFAENHALVCVGTGVTVTGRPSNVSLLYGTSGGQTVSFDPSDTANPTITSNGTFNMTEGGGVTYTPTANKTIRVYFDSPAGADDDIASIAYTHKFVTLPTLFYDDPQDADENNVYVIKLRAYTPQGGTAAQTMNVTVVAATITPPDIVARMTAAGSPPPTPALEAAYEAATATLASTRVYLKLNALQFTTHSDFASRVSWTPNSDNVTALASNQGRPLPTFIGGLGYKAYSGQWCYFNAAKNKWSADNLSIFMWSEGVGTGAIFGQPRIGFASVGNDLRVYPNSAGYVTVPDAFDSEGFIVASLEGNELKTYVDAELAQTNTVAHGTTIPTGSTRYGAMSDVSGVAPNPIKMGGWGSSLTAAEVETLWEVAQDINAAVVDYFAGLPPQPVTSPTLLGVVTEFEPVNVVAGAYNRAGVTLSYKVKIDGVQVATSLPFTIPGGSANKAFVIEEYATDAGGTSPANATQVYTIQVPPPSYFFAPSAQGSGNGSTPANAAVYTQMPTFVAAHPNSFMRLRADLGEYDHAGTLAFTSGDFTLNSYHPTDPTAKAIIRGDRANPYTAGAANGVHGLAIGADNIAIRNIDFRDLQYAIYSTLGLNGLTIEDCAGENVYRFFEGTTSRSHSNVYLRRNSVVGIERQFCRFGGGLHTFAIEDNFVDVDFVEDESFPSPIQLGGGSNGTGLSNGALRGNISKNVHFEIPGGYWNGDNFEIDDNGLVSGSPQEILFEDCEGDYATDANFDFKGVGAEGVGYSVKLLNCRGKNAKRGVKIFGGPHVLEGHVSEQLVNHGGTGNTNHYGVYRDGSVATFNNCSADNSGNVVFQIEQPNCRLYVNGGSYVPGGSQVLVYNAYPRSTHPSDYSEIIFNPPVAGHDQYGNPLDAPIDTRQYGPYYGKVTDSAGNVAIASVPWTPVKHKLA